MTRTKSPRLDAADLLQSHRGLVVSIARSLHQGLPGGVEQEDLEQAGYLGLYQAALRYDPDRGVQFATYASYYVRKEMLMAIRDASGSLRIPEKRYWQFCRIARAADQLGGGEDPVSSVSASEGLPEAYVSLALQSIRTAREDYEAVMATEETPSAEEVFFSTYREETILDAVSALTPREREALTLRFRFPPCDDGEGERPYEETARLMGISTPRAYGLVKSGLAKVRTALQEGSVSL